MGFKTEFNWILKLKSEQGLDENNLKENELYQFLKEEYRIYPINIPIDLINENWEALGKIIILEYTNKNKITIGKYKVIRIYNEQEKKILTNNWRENIQFIKGKVITNFSKETV